MKLLQEAIDLIAMQAGIVLSAMPLMVTWEIVCGPTHRANLARKGQP